MSSKASKQVSSTTNVEVIQIHQYRVDLLNDDYSTFDFVIEVLMRVFRKSQDEAERITRKVHVEGKGIAGVYPREIAVMKVRLVRSMADAAGYPLQAVIEEES